MYDQSKGKKHTIEHDPYSEVFINTKPNEVIKGPAYINTPSISKDNSSSSSSEYDSSDEGIVLNDDDSRHQKSLQLSLKPGEVLIQESEREDMKANYRATEVIKSTNEYVIEKRIEVESKSSESSSESSESEKYTETSSEEVKQVIIEKEIVVEGKFTEVPLNVEKINGKEISESSSSSESSEEDEPKEGVFNKVEGFIQREIRKEEDILRAEGVIKGDDYTGSNYQSKGNETEIVFTEKNNKGGDEVIIESQGIYEDGMIIEKDTYVEDTRGNIVVEKDVYYEDRQGDVVVEKDEYYEDRQGNVVIEKDFYVEEQGEVVEQRKNIIEVREDSSSSSDISEGPEMIYNEPGKKKNPEITNSLTEMVKSQQSSSKRPRDNKGDSACAKCEIF